MGRGYRWLGGIGYILSLIPFVNIVGSILVGIGWIMAGNDTRNGIFKATGIVLLVTLILGIGLIGILFPFIGGVLMSGFMGLEPEFSPRLFSNLLQSLGLFITLISGIAVLAIVGWVLELISHFRASKVYNVKWFGRAGWMRIISLIVAIIIVVFLVTQISGLLGTLSFTDPRTILNTVFTSLSILIIPVILNLIAIIFSAISFFTIPETPVEESRKPPELPPPP
ncbi:MAG: hypothetical protein ABDH32_01530 [Candidatus Caldarchaeales archaeon]